jgi:two-component system, OmpR family, response regulator CpxR
MPPIQATALVLEKPETATHRLLVVDDDVLLSKSIAGYLIEAGFVVDLAHRGDEGVKRALSSEYAMVVLEVNLPGVNGFEVLRRIRTESHIPVLVLTRRGEDIDRIVGLEIGADDYLIKPVNPRELVARIRAILRRARIEAWRALHVSSLLSVGDVALDRSARSVRRAGIRIELTSLEFDLLDMLLQAAGRVVERNALAKTLLGRELTPFERSIDMHVSNLRRKLGPSPGGSERIRSIRGVGYIYTAASEVEDPTGG